MCEALCYAENILWHYSTVMVCFGRGIVGPDVPARSRFRNWVIAFSCPWFLLRLLNISPLLCDLTQFEYIPPHMALCLYRRQGAPPPACTYLKILLHLYSLKNLWRWNLQWCKLLHSEVGLCRGICFFLCFLLLDMGGFCFHQPKPKMMIIWGEARSWRCLLLSCRQLSWPPVSL